MNTTTMHPPGLGLINNEAGIELPAAGRWHLHRASFVGFTVDRRRNLRPRLHDADLVVGAHLADPIELDMRVDDVEMRRLTAVGTLLTPAANGFASWELTGSLFDDQHVERTIEGELRYHGVFGRGTDTWAWLSGRASTSSRLLRRPDVEVVFDLVAFPSALRRPDGRPHDPDGTRARPRRQFG